jgi:molybdopterin-guanine dinucleotide biosynthesis protein A
MSKTDITGLILSGGSGQRFNRQDKGWALWQGRPMIEHCVDGLKPQLSRLIVCCNRHQEQYRQLGVDICQDQRPVFQGPLAGIEAGLMACDTELALLYPSDSPVVPEHLVETLLKALEQTTADVVYLRGFPVPQYLIALVNVQACLSVSRFLDDGGRSVREWYEELSAVSVEPSPAWQETLNINLPEELGA